MAANVSNELINNSFIYHPPKPGQAERYEKIRNKAREFALMLASECPKSKELDIAITNVEQSVMWANAAIARNE